jgi:hypothetical protein
MPKHQRKLRLFKSVVKANYEARAHQSAGVSGMISLSQVTELLKLAPRYLAAIALLSGILLFLPTSWANFLGAHEIVQNFRPWIGIVFPGSISLLTVDAACRWIDSAKSSRRHEKWVESVEKKLQSLTEDEKQILRFYFANQTKTNTLRINDGVVNGLVATGIIHLAARQGTLIGGFAHNIDDVAWDYIHEHADILDGYTNTYRTDKREFSRL